MNKEIKIGNNIYTDNLKSLNPTYENSGIYENESCFKISNLLFDYEIYISKKHKEGIRLKNMIYDKKNINDIINYLNLIIIKSIKISDIKREINYLENIAYLKGKEDMKTEFRNLLNLK